MKTLRNLAVPAVLSMALAIPAVAAAQERTVIVKGSATEKVPNDTAGLGFSVSKERSSRGAALRLASARLTAVIAAVQTVPGVGPGDVTTGRVTVRKVTQGKHVAYRAGEGIAVILHQPDRAGELISAAVAAGATGSSGPNFFAGDPELAFNNTLIAAFDQAKIKASALAVSAGATLGAAISIEEGTEVANQFAKSAPGEQQAEPSPPVKPGTSTVTASVRVVFALE